MTPNIPAIAEEIHKASARAVSIGIAHGGQGYSLSIGQVTKILTRHLKDEEIKRLREQIEAWKQNSNSWRSNAD